MSSFIINGGQPLRGDVEIPGNKNAVLPAMAASLLTDEEVILENAPHITDVKTMGMILQDLGAGVTGLNTKSIKINAANLKSKEPDGKLVADLRASVLLLGPLLARFGKTVLRHPGGDIIGRRSIEEHLKGLVKMGVKLEKEGIVNRLSVIKLRGVHIHLTEASVTATENIMLAAVLADGETIITNAAAEPHVQCLGTLLTKMGAQITGLGSHMIRIQGVSKLHGCIHQIRPDHIEVGTWAIAAAVTGGEITIHRTIAEDLFPIRAYLGMMGVNIHQINCGRNHSDGSGVDKICLKVTRGNLAAASNLKTNVWPGFPTDLMSPTIVLATQCLGTTLAHDWMYEGRMFFVDRLIKMGANIIVADPHRVIINGPTLLFARHTSSPDIRAGMALVLAALIAKGKSQIDMVEMIDRGYEDLERRLVKLGAGVKRIP